jgi:hypothetical protein
VEAIRNDQGTCFLSSTTTSKNNLPVSRESIC